MAPAVARIRSLAQEIPYATDVAGKKKKNFSINVQMWNFFRMQGIKLNFKYLNKENALFDRTRDDGLVLGLINNLEKQSDKFSDSAT